MGFFNNQRTVIFLVCLIFFHLRFGIYNDFAVNAADGVKRGRGIYYNDETYGVVPFKNQGTGVVIDARWIKFANRGSAEFWSEYVHVREKLFLGIDEHGNKIDVAAELKRLEDLVLPLIAQFQLDHPPSSPSSENGVLVIYEPITDALFYSFIDECLAEAPVDGECTKWASKNDFGTMPNWNTRYVTDMAGMDTTDSSNWIAKGFNGRSRFDGDISKWDVSSVTNMQRMFTGARAFNQPISNWVVSSVKNMEQMFANTRAFNQPIGIWDVSSVTNMGHMFGQNRVFNQDISKWSGKAATSSQSSMFYDATAFKIKYSCADSNNGPVSTCACIKCIPAASFKTFIADCLQEAPIDGLCTTWASNNKPYGTMPNWETDFVLDMSSAFKDKTQFKGDISNWDVSKATNMSEMFYNAADFNSDISSWDVSKVTNMSEMFYNAASFYRDLTKWTGPAATSSAQVNMFFGATAFRAKFTSCDYSQNHPANSCYCPNCIPDASFHSFVDECLAEAGAEVTGECTTWAAEKLAIDGKNYGTMPNWDTSIVRDMSGRLSKGPWTTQGFGNKHSFNGDISQWDTSSAKNMHSMFFKALAFNADISRWDVSSVTTMNSMFFQASAFDKDISKWLGPAAISEQADMFSGATQFQETFSCANARNGPASSCKFQIPSSESFKIFIDECLTLALNDGLCTTWSKVSMYGTMPNWGTRSVTDMSDAFKDKASFNGDISKWDTSNVLNMTNMFYGASAFNKDISKWDTSNVSNMESMFYGASAFNRDISKWDTSSVSNMGSMFYGASAFNKNISGWKGPAATTTAQTNMFFGATAFNLRYTCDFDGIVSGCSCPKCIPAASFKTFVTDCLAEASVTGECDYWASDKPYGTMPSWDTSLVRDMSSTFSWKWDFNADISNWDVSQVENMEWMFAGNGAFNQPIGNWDVSQATTMSYTFYSAPAFNQPIGNWDVSQVTTMRQTFQEASAFNQPIGNWEVSQVTDMYSMFYSASAFNQDISTWTGPASMTTQNSIFSGATAFQAKFTCKDNNNGPVSSCSVKPGLFAESAVNTVSELEGQPSGTYWIKINGTPTELYCDLVTNGGGWTSFASAPASGRWFTGDSGSNSWSGLSYTHGTYSSSGAVGDYWRDYSAQTDVDQILFKTGNGLYWMILNLTDVKYPQIHTSGVDGLLTMVASSGNMGADPPLYEENTKAYYFLRGGDSTNNMDPVINAGNSHKVGSNYMFWCEADYYYEADFKNANGGILLFVRKNPA